LVHFSSDGWTSRINLSFLGISAQFVDKNFGRHKVLLGLPYLDSRHTGEAPAEEVPRFLDFWELNDKLGFFTLDNATTTTQQWKLLDIALASLERNDGFAAHHIAS